MELLSALQPTWQGRLCLAPFTQYVGGEGRLYPKVFLSSILIAAPSGQGECVKMRDWGRHSGGQRLAAATGDPLVVGAPESPWKRFDGGLLS